MQVRLMFNKVEWVPSQRGWGRTRNEVVVDKTWTRKHTFIHRTSYNNKLWDLGERVDDTWVIDLRERQLAPVENGRLVTIVAEDGLCWFSGDLKRSFEMEDMTYSEVMCQYILTRLTIEVGIDGEDGYATRAWLNDNDYYDTSIGWVQDPHEYDLCFTEDTEEWMHVDDAYWSEHNECWYSEPTGEDCYDDEHICGYHHSPEPVTIAGPTPSDVWFGYEVEKGLFYTDDHGQAEHQGDMVGAFEIFKGYEYDGSCGVEAITNILPGNPESIDFVNGLVDDAAVIFNSPTNDQCGGHLTISREGMSGIQVLEKMRPYMGAVYAMFTDRLNNSYCQHDKKLLNQGSERYKVMNVMNNRVEMRIPSMITSAEEFKIRHKILVTIVDYAMGDKGYWGMLQAISPLLAEWYTEQGGIGDQSNVVEVTLTRAIDFRAWLLRDESSDRIKAYIPNELTKHFSVNNYRYTITGEARAVNAITRTGNVMTRAQRALENDRSFALDTPLTYRVFGFVIRVTITDQEPESRVEPQRGGDQAGPTMVGLWNNIEAWCNEHSVEYNTARGYICDTYPLENVPEGHISRDELSRQPLNTLHRILNSEFNPHAV